MRSAQLYRECIDRVHEKTEGDRSVSDHEGEENPGVPTVTLSQLKESVGDGEFVMTEIDVVGAVFEVLKSEVDSSITETGGCAPLQEYEYLLTLAVAYAHSLLSVLIYPHKKLQQFLFNLATISRHFNTLQQLLNFHVIMDSTELLDSLANLEVKYGSEISWIALTRLDTAMRMRKTEIVVDCLIKQKRSVEICDYIRRHDPQFDMDKLVHAVSERNINLEMLWEQHEIRNRSHEKIPTS
jgi:hypothetical protein